jgi:hypothetical protein
LIVLYVPCAACSRQFGRALAPTVPRRVHTIRGLNAGTGMSSDHGSALMVASWWQIENDTAGAKSAHVAEPHRPDRAPGFHVIGVAASFMAGTADPPGGDHTAPP